MGANALGNVGGLTVMNDVTPVVQVAAYATGNLIGGKISFSTAMREDGATGILQSVTLCSKSALAVDVDLILFDSDPVGTTFTERSAIAVATTDAAKVLAAITLSTRVTIGTPVVASRSSLNIPLKCGSASRIIYGAMIARGAFTPASTTDLTIRLGVVQDV